MHLWRLIAACITFTLVSSAFSQSTPHPQPHSVPEAVPRYEEQGYWRFGHFLPEAEAVDVYVDDVLLTANLAYPQLGAWAVLPRGDRAIRVVTAGTDEVLLATTEFVRADRWVTAGLVTVAAGVDLSLIPQAMFTVLPTTVQTTFANMLASGERVHFTRNDVVFFAGVPVVPGRPRLENIIPMDSLQFNFNATIAGENVGEDIFVPMVDTSAYLFLTVGTAAAPQLLIDETPLWEMRVLRGELAPPATIMEALEAASFTGPFLEAVAAAGLEQLLRQPGPFTLFVPADYAMDDVDLTRADLERLLRYHIVPGDLKAGHLFLQGARLTNIDGDPLPLTQTEHGFIFGTQIIVVNITAANGTIHLLNGVLPLPQ